MLGRRPGGTDRIPSLTSQFDSGWFHKSKFEAIKNILRRKWLALSDGRELTEADLETELEEYHAEIDSDDKDTQPPKKPTGGAAPGRRKPGRPKGGGGYAAGHIPAGQTMRQLAPSERWKRKGVALIPFNEEQLQVGLGQPKGGISGRQADGARNETTRRHADYSARSSERNGRPGMRRCGLRSTRRRMEPSRICRIRWRPSMVVVGVPESLSRCAGRLLLA